MARHHKDESLDDLLKRLPSELFKFTGLSGQRHEWIRRLVIESDLYFARPSCFNDPLDCSIPPTFTGSMLASTSYWRESARRKIPRAIITGIIFGTRTDAQTERAVRGWVTERRGGIELLRVTNKTGSFELQLKPA